MPIPPNIQREHIFQAMLKIRNEGVPVHCDPERWVLEYAGFQYPCKLLISWGNLFANGLELDPNPNNFTTQSAQRYGVFAQVIPDLTVGDHFLPNHREYLMTEH